jgi:protein-S-isoprenylcysteine O-methyltransferase Ste14
VLLFRLRSWVFVGIFLLGFLAPWDRWITLDGRQKTWLALAELPWRAGWMSLDAATITILAIGILLALGGAWLRTWGGAYLGESVVQSGSLISRSGVVADGPFRYVRNPLYLGLCLHSLALAMLMPPSGAVFSVLATSGFTWLLICEEERFLIAKLGEQYVAYKQAVPSVLPALQARVPSKGLKPRWGLAALAEIAMWGVAGSYAVLGWRYNAMLLTKCVVVSFGVSLVVRALLPAEKQELAK